LVVVQDDYHPLGRCYHNVVSLSLNSNLLQARILYLADSKKAPLGRFFTLVGRAG
jgi:hypothetical protein